MKSPLASKKTVEVEVEPENPEVAASALNMLVVSSVFFNSL
jgi:hypothetical protein